MASNYNSNESYMRKVQENDYKMKHSDQSDGQKQDQNLNEGGNGVAERKENHVVGYDQGYDQRMIQQGNADNSMNKQEMASNSNSNESYLRKVQENDYKMQHSDQSDGQKQDQNLNEGGNGVAERKENHVVGYYQGYDQRMIQQGNADNSKNTPGMAFNANSNDSYLERFQVNDGERQNQDGGKVAAHRKETDGVGYDQDSDPKIFQKRKADFSIEHGREYRNEGKEIRKGGEDRSYDRNKDRYGPKYSKNGANNQYDGGVMQTNEYFGDKELQEQLELLRSIEASKQMLYVGFGNVITILEEYEKRELEQKGVHMRMPKSKIPIPNQAHKSFATIKSIVEGQLYALQTQIKFCPPEAFCDLKNDMRQRTLSWAAVRTEMGIKGVHKTDQYISQLYEILAKGSTIHNLHEKPVVSAETIKRGFGAFLQGNHDTEMLDEEYRTNIEKKANAPETRRCKSLNKGVIRIKESRPKGELNKHLEEDLERYKNEKPDLK